MKQVIDGQEIFCEIKISALPQRSLFGFFSEEKEPETGIRITAENWSQYLKVIQKVYTDSTTGLKSYKRGINYLLMLKEEYAEKLDHTKESELHISTRYTQKLCYAHYEDGKLKVGDKVTKDNADQRVLSTFRCASGKELDEYLEKEAAEVQKEDLTINNRGLCNGTAIGWFGLQRYRDVSDEEAWTDENIFAYWCADEFSITKLEGVIYLKEE